MNFASLYNYYEHLVFDYITRELAERFPEHDEEYFLDVACYSLTRLPARYIRHEIDMMYYLEPGEHARIEERVAKAVEEAAQFIDQREKERRQNHGS